MNFFVILLISFSSVVHAETYSYSSVQAQELARQVDDSYGALSALQSDQTLASRLQQIHEIRVKEIEKAFLSLHRDTSVEDLAELKFALPAWRDAVQRGLTQST